MAGTHKLKQVFLQETTEPMLVIQDQFFLIVCLAMA